MSQFAAQEVRFVSHRAKLVPVFFGLLLMAGAVALWAGAQSVRAAVSQTIYAGFDADGNIKMSFADGTMIGTPNPPGTVVPAGTYQVILNNNTDDDLAVLHKFHLFGPGVDFSAGSSVQITTTVTFQPNSTYVYQDDLHTDIRDVFGTPGSGATSSTSGGGSSGSSSGSTTSSSSTGGTSSSTGSQSAIGTVIKSDPFRGALAGTVSSTGKLTLTRNGKAVATIKSGRYSIAVQDQTSKAGFTVQEIRKQPVALTGVSFVGKHTVTVDLKAGQWMFYSSSAKKNYFVVIT